MSRDNTNQVTSIEKMWTVYRKSCVHDRASESQVRQTRQAFMAGFFSMFTIVEHLSLLSDDAAVALLKNYSEEITKITSRLQPRIHNRPIDL